MAAMGIDMLQSHVERQYQRRRAVRGLRQQQASLEGSEYGGCQIAGTRRRTQFPTALHDRESAAKPLRPGVKASDELRSRRLGLVGQLIGERTERATGGSRSIQRQNRVGPAPQRGGRIQLADSR